MRDLLVTLVVAGSLPVILARPWIGILVWAWIGFMSPHRLTWGFAYDFPFALVIGVTTLVGLLFSGQWRRMPLTRETMLLALFVGWMFITTLFALNPTDAWDGWDKTWKIQLMVFVSMILLRTPERIRALIWVIVVSIGFYGVKGGVFTVVGGGENRVWGPPGSFIEGNNEIGLALIMIMPLARYLQLSAERWWVKTGLLIAMVLCGAAILGTHSRGAFVGLAFMLFFLAAKSRNRIPLLLAMSLAVPAGLLFMPETWTERMRSIQTYDEDTSVTGRFNAWHFAWNLALYRPVLGGGFETFEPSLFRTFAPDPDDFHDAHSIYFEVLGEHGFVGIILFLSLMLVTWFGCSWSTRQVRRARDDPDLLDCRDLARMLQVSIVGYAVSGAFLGLAYFDLYYNVVALAVLTRLRVMETLTELDSDELAESDEAIVGESGPRLGGAGRSMASGAIAWK